MIPKIAVIQTVNFDASNYSEVIQDKFVDITQNETAYKKLFAFNNYIDDYDFDFVFDSIDGYEAWLLEGVDTTITKVAYDWENDKAYITIADTNFPGPHEFDCTEEWTIEDCQNAINEKFNIA